MSENWIDLSNIPKYKGCGTRGKYVNDWKHSIGCRCNFSCENITDYFIIKKYEKNYLTVIYNNNEVKIDIGSIRKCDLRTLIGKRNKKFKVPIGTTFVDNNRNISIINQTYKVDSNNIQRKMYKYHCNICNWNEGWIEEGHLLNGIGCSCCSKSTIVPYKNDVYTTNPEYIKYFKNVEDTHKTTFCCKTKFMMVCPNCGNEQIYSTDLLLYNGFSCKKCGDGISYGEKFIYSLLKNCEIDFITQLSHTTFDWCNRYKYDFYIPYINAIIEVHGRQHYFDKDSTELYGYCKDNDLKKEQLAKENGITNYIIIDCRKSELTYIKNSIINCNLLELLHKNSSEIDWLECDRFTSKSYISLVCKYKNDHPELSTTDIGKVFHMARTTIQTYLQKGSDLGICIYDKEFERKFKTKNAKLKYYNHILNTEVSA